MSYLLEYKRTSMSLDLGTIDALRKLASLWGVSKAEVMRRAIKTAEKTENMKIAQPSPLEALSKLQSSIGLNPAEAAALREQIQEERQAKRYWWEE
jgi:hypothetical protein